MEKRPPMGRKQSGRNAHPLVDLVQSAISTHRLLPSPDSRVLVAVSGGADSVALLHVLCELGYECIAAHCNFHLRGAESDRDMAHVIDLCDTLGVDLALHHFKAADYAAEHHISVEMACRELRYRWFDRLLDIHKAPAIAVAHHRDDDIETFFLNLFRGTGIDGLTGMSPRRDNVIRPMLLADKAMTEDYLMECGLQWAEDSSNADCRYRRNAIRNRILPLIDKTFPQGRDAVWNTIGHLRDAAILYHEAIDAKRRQYVSDDGLSIDLSRLVQHERTAATLLHHWLEPLGLSAEQIRSILASATRSGAQFQGTSGRAVTHRGRLLLEYSHAAGKTSNAAIEVSLDADILTPIHIIVTHHSVAEFATPADANTLCLDESVLHDSPRFELRRWRRGDRMRPFGLHGSKKVSDIFADAHYSLIDKQQAWLLTRNDEILWIVGLRTSAQFAVLPSTRRFISLRMVDRR